MALEWQEEGHVHSRAQPSLAGLQCGQTDSRSQLPGPRWNRRWESACRAGPRTEGGLVLEPGLEVVFPVGD